MKKLTRHAVVTLDEYSPQRYALDPALGTVELESRLAEVMRLERAVDRNATWARVMFYGGCLLGLVAVGVTLGSQFATPVGVAAGLIAVVGWWTFAFKSDTFAGKHARLIEGWDDAGEAINESHTDGMVVSDAVPDEDVFRALQLLRIAKTGDSRITKATSLRDEDRLASDAHPRLNEVARVPGELRQQAADLLDPRGERTNATLDEASW